jgi:hypothetical protein
MPLIPKAPIAVNHTIITGPNALPTTAEPNRCEANRITMMTTVMGTTQSCNDGSTIFTPSTAESTEIAGVIMLSPKKSAAPKIPRPARVSFVRRPPGTPPRRIRVMSAMIPPSPSLSARITSSTYLTVTTMVTDQTMSDTNP